MAAVPLFWNTNMAAVTSCENALFLMDLFTDTMAILYLLDLRGVMGCQRGTRSAFTRAFWAKGELHSIFLEKKAIIIKSKQGAHNALFYPFRSLS